MKKSAIDTLLVICKVMVAAALLGFLVSKMNFHEVAGLADKRSAVFLMVAVLLGVPLFVIDSLTFRIVLHILGYRLGVTAALVYTIVATFFSNLAPGTVGGDVFRAIQMYRVGVPFKRSLRMVVVVRVTALSALFFVVLLGLPFLLTLSLESAVRLVTFTCLVMMAAALLASLTADRFAWILGLDLINRVATISRDLRQVLFGSRFSFAAIVCASLVHIIRVLIVYALALALDTHLSLTSLFVVVPIALLIAMVPVSFANWGTREASFIYFLGQIGASFETALIISILFGLQRVLFGIVGGLVWIGAKKANFGVGLNLHTS